MRQKEGAASPPRRAPSAGSSFLIDFFSFLYILLNLGDEEDPRVKHRFSPIFSLKSYLRDYPPPRSPSSPNL